MTVITQAQLSLFQAQFPNDPTIGALTLAEVQANTADKVIDWSLILANPPALTVSRATFFKVTACDVAIAKVIVDVVLFAIGASELSGKINAETLESVAVAAEEGLVEIEALAKEINEADGALAKAKIAFKILGKIVDIGCLGAVVSAIFKSLSWWDMILYGIVAVATIVALVATDGASFAAELVILIVGGAFLVEDTANCIGICSAPNPPPPPPSVCGMQTWSKNFITVVNGGAIGDQVAALNTEDSFVTPHAKFTVVPINKADGTFALKCPDGLYLTAINGGGVGGPNNHEQPVHTNATSIGKYEQVVFEQQDDGTICISSCYQYYITAVNGGGWPDNGDHNCFRTNTVQIGPWETFKLIQPD